MIMMMKAVYDVTMNAMGVNGKVTPFTKSLPYNIQRPST